MGPSLVTRSLHNYLHSIVIYSSRYAPKKVKTLIIQSIKVSPFVSLSKVLPSISKVYNVKFKIVYKIYSKVL